MQNDNTENPKDEIIDTDDNMTIDDRELISIKFDDKIK